MQGRLVIRRDDERERAERMGISDVTKKFTMMEMASGDCFFSATGVTDGNMLDGVKFGRTSITTETVVMRASSGTVRHITTKHRDLTKFDTPAS